MTSLEHTGLISAWHNGLNDLAMPQSQLDLSPGLGTLSSPGTPYVMEQPKNKKKKKIVPIFLVLYKKKLMDWRTNSWLPRRRRREWDGLGVGS